MSETRLAEVLAEVMGVERVPVGHHFFNDLGADSLVMAHFCARVRNRADLPAVSMKDVYRHPTIERLATAVGDGAEPGPAGSPGSAPADAPTALGTAHYVLCGVLQVLAFVGYGYVVAVAVTSGYEWLSLASGPVDVYLRSVAFGGVSFIGLCFLPILVKWVLVGRWRPQQIRIWSLRYVRFWIVTTLVRSNPLVLFVGTPLYVLYLRALGARVGRGAAIFSRNVPACTDLLTVGAGATIRKDSYFACYRAESGVLRTGTVTIGEDAFVGEATVLDIETSLGDGAQIGHASSLDVGQAVPPNEHRHGSPAQPTEVDYRDVEPAVCTRRRRLAYSVLQLLKVLLVQLPLAIGGITLVLTQLPQLAVLLGPQRVTLTSWEFLGDALAASLVLFAGSVVAGLLVVLTVPRLLNRALTPDTVYPLYGVRYGLHRAIARLTNITFFTYLFGDSSAIVHYFRALGYGLSPVEQTGSNFGLETKHENPYLSSVGSATMVADGLSIMNAELSSTSFRVSRASIGRHNFVGNYVAFPAQARTGDNCLLATKVMVPVDGPVRTDVGLLGSPSFEIPRSVQRDSRFDHLATGDELHRRLAAKNRHNAMTMVFYLVTRWMYVFGVTVIALAAADLHHAYGAWAISLAATLITVLGVAHFVLVERCATRLRALRPRYCSIYQPYFWRHERYWKLSTQPKILDGTPFKGPTWRLLGVRIGARVFDGGCVVMEKTMVTIGDDCALNTGSIIQPHSQEDGAFKSDRIVIGSGCALGVGTLVHYGVTIGDGATISADSFLMKGEQVPPHARWGGNPARQRSSQ